jgi:antitoxin HigA-1
MAKKPSASLGVHPGIWLRNEIVKRKKLSISELADHFGVSRQAMSSVLNGHVTLSADMAIRFEKALGLKAEKLCRMQAEHDLATARRHERRIKVKRFEPQ